jgi:hypothetical protein
MLRLTRELYNALREQRRDRWRRERGRVTDQYRQITELRAADLLFAAVYRECLDACCTGSIWPSRRSSGA